MKLGARNSFRRITALLLSVSFLCASTACMTAGYKNVDPDSLLASVRTGMGTTELYSVIGMPTDYEQRNRIGVMILWVPMLVILIGYFFHPPLTKTVYYYKGEGRIYLSPGWGVGPAGQNRVRGVVGDPTEDGHP